MNPFEIAGGILLLISSLVIIFVIMIQESPDNGMGAISGSTTDNFAVKNPSNTREALLMRLTKILATVFFVVSMAMNLIIAFMK